MKFLEANALAITAVVAVFALIQPWIFAAWRKYFRQGSIEIYQTGNLEIGYSGFGPTIGLNGTLRCIHRDLFVQTIQLELIKEKDSSKHSFDWGVFRSEKITVGGQDQATFELPCGFMLSTSLPQRFNIQFHDTQVQSEMRQVVNKLSEEWSKVRSKSATDELRKLSIENASLPPQLREPFLALYEGFSKSEVYLQSYESVVRTCYWEAGKYTLKMIVRTSKPDRSFEKYWDFALTEQETQAIRLNVIKLLQDICGGPSYGPYSFAFPEYESK